MTDTMAKLVEAQKRSEEKIAELAEAQTALIHIVDGLIRENRNERQQYQPLERSTYSPGLSDSP